MNLSLIFHLIVVLGYFLPINRKNVILLIMLAKGIFLDQKFFNKVRLIKLTRAIGLVFKECVPASPSDLVISFLPAVIGVVLCSLGYVVIPSGLALYITSFNPINLHLLIIFSLSAYSMFLVSVQNPYPCYILGLIRNTDSLVIFVISTFTCILSLLVLIGINFYDNTSYTLFIFIVSLVSLLLLIFNFNKFKEDQPGLSFIIGLILLSIVLLTSSMLGGQLLGLLYRLFMNSAGSSSNPGGSAPSGGPGDNPPTGGPGGQPSGGPGGPGGQHSHNTPLSSQDSWRQKTDRMKMAAKGRRLYNAINKAKDVVSRRDSEWTRFVLNRKETQLKELTKSFISHEKIMISNNNLDLSANRGWPTWRVMGEALINQDSTKN